MMKNGVRERQRDLTWATGRAIHPNPSSSEGNGANMIWARSHGAEIARYCIRVRVNSGLPRQPEAGRNGTNGHIELVHNARGGS